MFNFGVHGAVVDSLPLEFSCTQRYYLSFKPYLKKRTPSWVRNIVDCQHSLPLLGSQQQLAMKLGCIRRLQEPVL